MGLLQGESSVKKIMHRAFWIRTDVGLALINSVVIFVAFILLSNILFVGGSAVGLDGEIFFCHKIYSFINIPGSPPPEPISAPC